MSMQVRRRPLPTQHFTRTRGLLDAIGQPQLVTCDLNPSEKPQKNTDNRKVGNMHVRMRVLPFAVVSVRVLVCLSDMGTSDCASVWSHVSVYDLERTLCRPRIDGMHGQAA
ncbi:unnamed protein product [Protopolystoma xenopodis]|uniref:Uncharacterized protein n=1 Tax=Protopolystoma xenopodis TaxID=117903 RepID=A0A448WXM1_9PLAT|nr:unnamed protein product [Protopolystoma xenopodis]